MCRSCPRESAQLFYLSAWHMVMCILLSPATHSLTERRQGPTERAPDMGRASAVGPMLFVRHGTSACCGNKRPVRVVLVYQIALPL